MSKQILNSHKWKVKKFLFKSQRILIKKKFPDKQQETLFYQIENSENTNGDNSGLQTIAQLFTLIESNKEKLNLETYSLSQTSLEQVFLSFASEQKMEEDTIKTK